MHQGVYQSDPAGPRNLPIRHKLPDCPADHPVEDFERAFFGKDLSAVADRAPAGGDAL